MSDVVIDAFKVEVLLVAVEAFDGLHAESVLEHPLGSQKEDVLVLVREVQRLRQDTEELRLLKGHTQPFIDDEFIKQAVELKFGHGGCLSLECVTEYFKERPNWNRYLAHR